MDGGELTAFVVGASLRSASLSMRDRLYLDDAACLEVMARLRNGPPMQVLVLSTCDRVEIQGLADDPRAVIEPCLDPLRQRAGDDPEGQAVAETGFYSLTGAEALRHMFAVAASLDSLVIGEPQVLAQVKAAHKLARDAGMVGPALELLMQAVLGTARKIRRETRIGEGPVSIAAAVIQLARDLHGDLDRRAGLMIGNGDMGMLVGEQLMRAGLGGFRVTHPKDRRAEPVARLLGCPVAPHAELTDALAGSDILITAMNGRNHFLSADRMAAVIKMRRRRPVLIIDTGIPGDVEPAVERLDEAFVFDLDDLEQVAHRGRQEREREAGAAWVLVDAAVSDYFKGRTERMALPSLIALRDHFEAMRQSALEAFPDDAERATRLLINRLLHRPSTALRGMASENRDLADLERLMIRLFALNGSPAPKPDGDDGDNEETNS